MAVRAVWYSEVPIPQEVFDKYHHKEVSPYLFEVNDAIKGYLEAGTIFYDDPYEFATFHTKEEALQCDRKLKCVMEKYAAIVKKEACDGDV